MATNYTILDLDGCIAHDAWRIPEIAWHHPDPFRRYDRYHQLSPWDACGNEDLFRDRPERILIFTSRPVIYRTLTEEWLKRTELRYAHLLMRNNDDHRPSAALKRAQLGWLAEYGVRLSEIVCAYDDRPEIISMYEAAGLRAELRALHEVSAYLNPLTGINHADGTLSAQTA